MARAKKRPAISRAPRREAGQSSSEIIQEEFQRAVYGLSGAYAFLLCAVLVFVSQFVDFATPNVVALFLCTFGIGLGVFAYRRLVREAKPHIVGVAGEKAMGDALSLLERSGFRVIHDVPSSSRPGANIDHLVVGETGVFAIETKTRSKPTSGRPVVRFDGESLWFLDGPADSGPVAQARACAEEARHTVLSVLGRRLHVRPVVAIPGWYVEVENGRPWDHEVLVGMEKNLLSFLSFHAPDATTLTRSEIDQIADLFDQRARDRAH